MTTSIMIHYVKSVSARNFDPTNDNAITLDIACRDTAFSVTVFGLSTADAEYISGALQTGGARMTEEEIRADERSKIASRLGL